MSEKAKNLKIRVVRDGEEKAFLTFPIFTLSVLHTVIPDHVLEKIKKRGIDIKNCVKKVEESGSTPQTIFEHSEENSSYKVWID